MTLDLRDVPASGRNIRSTDTAFGWEHSLTSEIAARRSSWQQVLELAGLYLQFSTDNATWSDAASNSDTHFRLASGTEKPVNTSARWSAGIALASGTSGTDGADGADGADGTNGADGADGADGSTMVRTWCYRSGRDRWEQQGQAGAQMGPTELTGPTGHAGALMEQTAQMTARMAQRAQWSLTGPAGAARHEWRGRSYWTRRAQQGADGRGRSRRATRPSRIKRFFQLAGRRL